LELFPDLREEISEPDSSVYELFSMLLPRCRSAYDKGNSAELARIFAYASWCSSQRADELWNAAGVAFFEHLPEIPDLVGDLPKWIPQSVFEDVAPLLQDRLSARELTAIRRGYG
jgi:hypothetical protein